MPLIECERVGKRHQRFADRPAGFDVVRSGKDKEPIAFGYRTDRTNLTFVYIPDPTYTFTATPKDLNHHGPRPHPMTWSEGLFVLARFFEGWYSI